jgi:hypothetical protein
MDYQNQNYGYTYNPQQAYNQRAVVEQTNAVMRRVYVRMFIGILISAFCALGVATSPTLLSALFSNSIIYWGMFIVMIAMAWILPARIHKMSTGTALTLFCVFSALMGTSLAPIFLVYRLGTIAYTFFITAGVFGAMSVYGYLTKTDLTKMGSYLVMALFGLIILSIVNIFLASSTIEWWISIIGVAIFIGLTAWDTQTAKKLAAMNMDPAMRDKLATLCALNLYLDFINLFLYLLRLFGASRD